jgi:GPH family glycoside/pentoside/hexuronide:cation symporter
MPQPMPRSRRVLFALGAPGWQITDQIILSVVVYFYLPPSGRGLDTQVSQTMILGALTVFGAATLLGRLFDMLADPVVGYTCDRSRSRLGRRRSFLLFGALPMVVTPLLLFWPPGAPGSAANAWWLAGVTSLYFIAFTVYVAPYLALIPEIAWTADERVNLSTLLAVAGIPAVLFGVTWTAGMDWAVGLGLTPADAVRAVVLAGSALALVLCFLPILAVDERRFCHSTPSDLPPARALLETLANRPFRRYLVAQLPFVVGLTMIRPMTVYYATVVLGRSEGFGSALGGALFGATLLAFFPVNRIARHWGPKRTITSCVVLLALGVALLGLLAPDVPGGPRDARNLTVSFAAMLMCGVAVAGFLTMPNVLISQVIDYDTRRTGANRAAMYFGVQGLATKMLYGVSGAILSFLFVRYGNSAEEPLGVLLVGPVAAVFCLASALLFLRYPEAEVLRASAQIATPSDGN